VQAQAHPKRSASTPRGHARSALQAPASDAPRSPGHRMSCWGPPTQVAPPPQAVDERFATTRRAHANNHGSASSVTSSSRRHATTNTSLTVSSALAESIRRSAYARTATACSSNSASRRRRRSASLMQTLCPACCPELHPRSERQSSPASPWPRASHRLPRDSSFGGKRAFPPRSRLSHHLFGGLGELGAFAEAGGQPAQ
jgi:hypothetical protein